jgi:hypothetical protein
MLVVEMVDSGLVVLVFDTIDPWLEYTAIVGTTDVLAVDTPEVVTDWLVLG